jgi:hypothetical protein
MLDEGNKFAARLSPKLEQEVARRFAEHQQQEKERVATFGEIRPQISLELKGRRFVVVGGTLHHSDKWKFFPDFLNDFVPAIFGKEWGQQNWQSLKMSVIQSCSGEAGLRDT